MDRSFTGAPVFNQNAWTQPRLPRVFGHLQTIGLGLLPQAQDTNNLDPRFQTNGPYANNKIYRPSPIRRPSNEAINRLSYTDATGIPPWSWNFEPQKQGAKQITTDLMSFWGYETPKPNFDKHNDYDPSEVGVWTNKSDTVPNGFNPGGGSAPNQGEPEQRLRASQGAGAPGFRASDYPQFDQDPMSPGNGGTGRMWPGVTMPPLLWSYLYPNLNLTPAAYMMPIPVVNSMVSPMKSMTQMTPMAPMLPKTYYTGGNGNSGMEDHANNYSYNNHNQAMENALPPDSTTSGSPPGGESGYITDTTTPSPTNIKMCDKDCPTVKGITPCCDSVTSTSTESGSSSCKFVPKFTEERYVEYCRRYRDAAQLCPDLSERTKLFERYLFCGLCQKNGEPPCKYFNHTLYNYDNIATCPVLRQYICCYCGATEDNAHILEECPFIIS